ncbi:MAG: 2-hydroxyacid dehydrogenase [Syntrophales bacterium]|jgi:D-lactate dehydrogenase|nr:2-hydroxyacid dehydrogenase [Syntrophales bacterium]MDY0043815.1 2-hydroxyacid dehydrogenase [Syntrophales bacterium]
MMKVLVYSSRPYDREFLDKANRKAHEFHFTEARLEEQSAVLAADFPAVCCFVSDDLDARVLQKLHEGGTRLVLLRATGFNNVDLEEAAKLGMTVMRVSNYSPYAVAEFAAGMILAMNRKIHRAYQRVREGNFRIDGLLGFDLFGKTVGIVGTGRIGSIFAKIMYGFGCNLLGFDKYENPECIDLGLRYVSLEELLKESDIVSLHAPLTPDTRYLINSETISLMKEGAMLINTSRGALVDTQALIPYLKRCTICAVCLDVYEEEEHIYYRDLSDQVITDDTISRLLTFPNVLITGHQAFFTQEAMETIAETTLRNLNDFIAGRKNENTVEAEKVMA